MSQTAIKKDINFLSNYLIEYYSNESAQDKMLLEKMIEQLE